MELKRFCRGIGLSSNAEERLRAMRIPEGEYERAKALFFQDREEFYGQVLTRPDYRMYFLFFFSRLGCEVYERYQEMQIPEAVYWDTFRDVALWCENCYAEFGEYGIDEYDWFFRHVELKIFRLGRLEFETMQSEWDLSTGGCSVKLGDPVINIHIPQGEKLNPAACRDSVKRAVKAFGKDIVYICHSWLLYPGLKEILGPGSNILEFQNLFWLAQVDYLEREAEWRIFTKVREDIEAYPENTSLQRAAKEYLMKGKLLGNGIGILKVSGTL